MRVEGLEPPRLAASEPKSDASANFAIPAESLILVAQPEFESGTEGYEPTVIPFHYRAQYNYLELLGCKLVTLTISLSLQQCHRLLVTQEVLM